MHDKKNHVNLNFTCTAEFLLRTFHIKRWEKKSRPEIFNSGAQRANISVLKNLYRKLQQKILFRNFDQKSTNLNYKTFYKFFPSK
jgi:hypothetical protein